jgi:hypothetical protein
VGEASQYALVTFENQEMAHQVSDCDLFLSCLYPFCVLFVFCSCIVFLVCILCVPCLCLICMTPPPGTVEP